jgi:quercetin dioxygenase-like cupin family protein
MFKRAIVAAVIASISVISAHSQQTGIKRTPLRSIDFPPGFTTVTAIAEMSPGICIGRHTHPGIESAFVLEGGFELPVAGQPTRMLKTGDGFQIPPNTPHAGGKPGDARTRVLITYIVEKDKPLASPA